MAEAVSAEFEIGFYLAGYESPEALVDPGKWLPDRWVIGYEAQDREWSVALAFPNRRQAEIALEACKRLGITPESYWQAANSPAGSGELRRRIMEMMPW